MSLKPTYQQLKRRVDELEKRDARRDLVLERLPDTVVSLDKKGEIVCLKKGGIAFLSHLTEGRLFFSYRASDQREIAEAAHRKAFDTATDVTYTGECDGVDGQAHHCLFYAVPVKEGRKVSSLLLYIRELPEEREEIGRFISAVNHDLRHPMTSILGFAKLGVERIDKIGKKKLVEYFECVRAGGEKMIFLLDNLLELSQLSAGNVAVDVEMERLSLVTVAVLNELFSLFRRNKVSVVFEKPILSDSVSIDINKIGRAIHCLLSNAARYSQEGSEITVEIIPRETEVEWSVTDSGVTIPENEIGVVFERFGRRAREEKSGRASDIGLTIAKEIIAEHRGEIWAEPNPGGGVILRFSIPRKKRTLGDDYR